MKPNVDWLALSPALSLLAAGGVALLGAVIVPRAVSRALAAITVAAGFAVAFVFAAVLYADAEDGRFVVADAFARDRWTALATMIVCGAGFLAVGVSWGEQLSSGLRRAAAGTGPEGTVLGTAPKGTVPAAARGGGGAGLRPAGAAAGRWPEDDRNEHVGEYYALLAAAAAGMVFFVGASNLMVLFLGLEWFSISLYILCAITGDRPQALEAGLKYLIVGSFGSAVLLFGSALVYGATGELGFGAIADAIRSDALGDDPLMLAGLAMLIAGLGFKSSAAPFHMWTPDVYQGAPTPVTAFMSAATKTAALVVTLRVLVTAFPGQEEFWTVAIAVLACISLAVGNLAALVQRDVKRLLAYSSVSHAGFMLIAVVANTELGASSLLYYLVPYSAMSIGSFAVVAARERELGAPVTLDNLAGMGWERPLLGVSMWLFMLGFAGLPLTGGFMGKFQVFSSASDAGWTWLVIVGVVATAVSVYYYFAVVRALYLRSGIEFRAAPAGGSPPRELLLQGSVLACVAVTVATFIAVDPLVDLAEDAASALPF